MVLAFGGTLLSSLVVGFLLVACLASSSFRCFASDSFEDFLGLLCNSKVAVSGWLPFDPDIPGGPTSISLPEARSRLVVQKPKAGQPL